MQVRPDLRALLILAAFFVTAQAADAGGGRLQGRPVAAVIDEFRDRGYPFVYSTNLVDASLLVVGEPEAVEPLAIVREILKPHGLALRSEADVYLVVRMGREDGEDARVLLIVHDAGKERPVDQPRIVFEPSIPAASELEPGVYELEAVPSGRYQLQVGAANFETVRRVVDVWPGETKVIRLTMRAAKPQIETIAVSASRYEISRDVSASRFSLDQRSIQTMPDIGDDPLRSVQRLPGAAASGASAKTYLRGGDRDEVGIVLNGQTLFDPFHVRDYQSVFSAIDSRAIEGVEVYTGGFPVRYGNRMSGMVLMETLEPLTERHTEIGISAYNTSLLMAGNEPARQWLFSARRGNLDLIIDPKLGSPSYYDVFGELAWQPSTGTSLSLNALFAEDRVELILESDPEELERLVSETRNAELWLVIDNRWSESLSSKTVLSTTWFDNLRRGTLDDEESIVASVVDERRISQFGFRQDFSYHPSDRHVLEWGLQIRHGNADYFYRSSAEYFGLQALFEGRDEPVATATTAAPEGSSYALYFADRWKLSANTTFEWGLRWDDQTYTETSGDAQLSPRLSMLRSLGERTELRLSWGRYHQAQEINELQIEDGVSNFWPAQLADHLILGIRHLFDERYSLRMEVFEKTMRDVRPRFENLHNPLGLIPELQPDRVRLDPTRGRSRGIEISLDRRSGPLTWWATYVLSEATDRIDGRDQLRSWDQRHAFQGGVNFSSEHWEWGLAANVHTGWPLTELLLAENGVDDDGEVALVATPGVRNAGRYPDFASLDLRIARKWRLPRGRLTAFVEISNLTNRRNQCCLDWDIEEDETTGEEILERGVDYWMPLLPAIGVLYEF